MKIGEAEPLLADLAAAWLAERPQDAASFPADPGEVVDDVLAAEWTDDDGQPLHPVAYSVGGYHGPILPRGEARADTLAAVLAKLGGHAEGVEAAFRGAAGDLARLRVRLGGPRARGAPGARVLRPERRGRRRGARVRLPARTRRGERSRRSPLRHRSGVARGSARPEDRGARRRGGRTYAAWEREPRRARPGGDDAEKQARREQRERDYAERVSARARNLDLGAALARWEPKLDTDAVKLLGSLVLLHYGKAAAWAHRLCVEQPTTTNKQGKATVRYPRGAQAEKQAHEAALAALMRTRTPEAALAVVLRLLVAQRLADTAGLPGADRQGVYEPQRAFRLEGARQARPAGCAAVGQAAARRQSRPSGRSASKAWRAEQAARIEEQRAKLAAGEAVRCECCLRMIESADDAAEKDGTLVHAGDCEQQWGSADDEQEDEHDRSGGPRRRSLNSTVRPTYYP